MEKIEFSDIERGLEQAKSDMRAAEAHGVLCGLLCGKSAVSHKEWLDLLVKEWDENDLLMKELIKGLSILHITTLQNLNDSELKFNLFLPDDQVDIDKRVVALADWCQGFLFGIGMHLKDELLTHHKEVSDVIKDIQDIGQADAELKADEEDFFEITEYLRMAILMIYDTLQPVHNNPIVVD